MEAPALLPTLALLAVALPLLYIYTASVASTRFPTLRGRRICLLIAHPDDEAMFFAPTVLSLTRPESGNHVEILCLSTGDADGLGDTRRRELAHSAVLLGLRGEEDVQVVDSPDFPDSMTQTWDTARIADLLRSKFVPRQPPSSSSKSSSTTTTAPTATIDALITFDSGGVSSHPNHISLYHGARSFVSLLSRPGWAPPVDLYTLTTVPVWRKYVAFLDAFLTIPIVSAAVLLGGGRSNNKNSKKWTVKKSDRGNPGVLVSMSGLFGSGRETYGAARRAMTDAHKSQMVWFRWGWIALSRYMYINDLRLERVKT
ncbi:hypothetical protein DL767_002830 [Monosporascus sp. MG133]|nr:hypothetical protein DL767_002830 [Monosporascus sp. MG133]